MSFSPLDWDWVEISHHGWSNLEYQYRLRYCEHDRERHICEKCTGLEFCRHKSVKSKCQDCARIKICKHGRNKNGCFKCLGAFVCEHSRARKLCRDCMRNKEYESKRIVDDMGLSLAGISLTPKTSPEHENIMQKEFEKLLLNDVSSSFPLMESMIRQELSKLSLTDDSEQENEICNRFEGMSLKQESDSRPDPNFSLKLCAHCSACDECNALAHSYFNSRKPLPCSSCQVTRTVVQ